MPEKCLEVTMKQVFICLLILSLFLAGCSTTRGYERVLNSWMGSNVNSLIQSWGPPSGVYNLPNGDAMYTWFDSYGAMAMPIGNMAYAVNRSCKTTFTADSNGRIISWRYEGNACRA